MTGSSPLSTAWTLGTDGFAWCSCRDFIVGGHRCKHMAVLALSLMREDALRAAEAQASELEQRRSRKRRAAG
ncbi:SWIM zinc finger family protein [Thermacetogenium phaeum]